MRDVPAASLADLTLSHPLGGHVPGYDFKVPLLDGTYAVTIGVHTRGGLVYDSWEQLRRFEVAAPGRDIGLVRLPVQIESDGRVASPDR